VCALALHVLTLVAWAPSGRRVLFVYSNSPVWPTWSLSVSLFRFYAGTSDYNPLAIVIRPWRAPKVFRFWRTRTVPVGTG
jgi:hypothetical protein